MIVALLLYKLIHFISFCFVVHSFFLNKCLQSQNYQRLLLRMTSGCGRKGKTYGIRFLEPQSVWFAMWPSNSRMERRRPSRGRKESLCCRWLTETRSLSKVWMRIWVEWIFLAVGACEGSLGCATCHILLDQKTYDKLPEPSEAEEDLLDSVPGLTETYEY